MSLSEEVLMGIAAIAIALIGFSGVVTALGRRGAGKWSPSEKLQLQTLVDPALVTLTACFAPIALGLITENVDIIWRASNAIVFLGHCIGYGVFLRRGAPNTVLLSHKIGGAITVAMLVATLGSSLGFLPWTHFTFLFGLLVGIGVSVHNFYLLLFQAGTGSDGFTE